MQPMKAHTELNRDIEMLSIDWLFLTISTTGHLLILHMSSDTRSAFSNDQVALSEFGLSAISGSPINLLIQPLWRRQQLTRTPLPRVPD